MRLFYEPEGRLRLTLEDRSYIEVRPVWASPMSHPGKYLALVDGRDKEILMLTHPEKELSKENWEVAQLDLQRRYLNGFILEIHEAKTVFGYTYWTVTTERGRREFVTMSLQENAQWLSPVHLIIMDVDGNRFEVSDVERLPIESRKLLETTV